MFRNLLASPLSHFFSCCHAFKPQENNTTANWRPCILYTLEHLNSKKKILQQFCVQVKVLRTCCSFVWTTNQNASQKAHTSKPCKQSEKKNNTDNVKPWSQHKSKRTGGDPKPLLNANIEEYTINFLESFFNLTKREKTKSWDKPSEFER